MRNKYIMRAASLSQEPRMWRLQLVQPHQHAAIDSPLVERLRLGVQRRALLDRNEAFRTERLPGLCDSSKPASQFLLTSRTRFLAHNLAAETLDEIRLLQPTSCLRLLSLVYKDFPHLALCDLAHPLRLLLLFRLLCLLCLLLLLRSTDRREVQVIERHRLCTSESPVQQ